MQIRTVLLALALWLAILLVIRESAATLKKGPPLIHINACANENENARPGQKPERAHLPP